MIALVRSMARCPRIMEPTYQRRCRRHRWHRGAHRWWDEHGSYISVGMGPTKAKIGRY